MLSKLLRDKRALLLLASLFLCVSIITLWVTNSLTLYIHPRYEIFTVSLVFFGGCVLLYDLLFNASAKVEKVTLPAILTVVFCAAALILPTQTLSSRAALSREQTTYATETVATSSYDEFSTDYSNLTISDWSNLLSQNPPIEEIQDKTATIEGFALLDEDKTSLARFRISCCSVDATPLTISLQTEESLTADEWYTVTGSFILENDEYILVVENLESIPEPESPYVF